MQEKRKRPQREQRTRSPCVSLSLSLRPLGYDVGQLAVKKRSLTGKSKEVPLLCEKTVLSLSLSHFVSLFLSLPETRLGSRAASDDSLRLRILRSVF